MSKHKPEPWHIHATAGDHDFSVYGNSGPDIALVRGYNEEAEANARLIAAAPDFIEGAREAVAAWDMEEDTAEWNHEDRLERAIALLRAAIAKAEGA